MIKTKQLAIAGIMLLSALQVDAKIKKTPTTPQTKKEISKSRIRGLIQQQSPMFIQKKTRGGSRLIANANYDITSGSAVISDSAKYNYLPTNGYGYDETPSLFEINESNTNYNISLYDDQKNTFDNADWYINDGTGSLALSITNSNSFNSTHQLTQNVIDGSAMGVYLKSNIAYNTSGRKYEMIDTLYFNGFGSIVSKSIYSFNANNKVNVIDVFQKDSATQTWIQYEKDSLFYDINSNVTSVMIYDVSGTVLTKSEKITCTYNAANKMLSELDELWNGTSWEINSIDGKIEYTYNSSNQLLTQTILVWNGTNYDNESKTTYTYGTATYPTSATYSTWNGTSWDDDDRDVYTYNTSNQVLTDNYSTWNGTAWVPSTNGIYYYEIFAPQALSNTTLDATVSMYPNPVENILNLNIQLNQEDNISIAVVDINGKVVYQSTSLKGKNITTSINTNSFAKGIYLVQIKGNNGETVSKFVK